MVDIEIIKSLVDLMVENDLAEISIRDGEEEIILSKPAAAIAPPAVAAMPAPAPPPLPAPEAAPAPAPAAAEPDPDEGLTPVTSPMVGTFYAAPDPASPPYVKVGDHVTPDTVVCIIEAMKVFNEIKAGVSGRIERALVGNEEAIEYGQPLYLVRP